MREEAAGAADGSTSAGTGDGGRRLGSTRPPSDADASGWSSPLSAPGSFVDAEEAAAAAAGSGRDGVARRALRVGWPWVGANLADSSGASGGPEGASCGAGAGAASSGKGSGGSAPFVANPLFRWAPSSDGGVDSGVDGYAPCPPSPPPEWAGSTPLVTNPLFCERGGAPAASGGTGRTSLRGSVALVSSFARRLAAAAEAAQSAPLDAARDAPAAPACAEAAPPAAAAAAAVGEQQEDAAWLPVSRAGGAAALQALAAAVGRPPLRSSSLSEDSYESRGSSSAVNGSPPPPSAPGNVWEPPRARVLRH
jgi:hypothetical protein